LSGLKAHRVVVYVASASLLCGVIDGQHH
jgi:hypothetical protein